MIQTIIFSFDRAMQLSLLLESIKKYDSTGLLSVHVLYAFSSEEYRKAYDRLKTRHPDVEWTLETHYPHPQLNFEFQFSYAHNWYWWLRRSRFRNNPGNFKAQLMSLLEKSDSPFTMFLTDDSLFYRPIAIPESCMEQIKNHPRHCSFSLRHGMNLSGGIYEENPNHIAWNAYTNDSNTDWGYPFSVDGHIYFRSAIRQIVHKILLNNPNSMEGNIYHYIKSGRRFANLTANKQSSLVGFELNRVQTLVDNHHYNISPEQLNRYFLNDYTLQINFDATAVSFFRPAIQSLFVEKGSEANEIWNPVTLSN
jgi:hypothetical protein